MSFKSLLKHRCTVLELIETSDDGSPVTSYQPKAFEVRCFLDLNFIRRGKDPMWTAEAGRPADRTGVLFLSPAAPIVSGDRILMTTGPAGTFSIEGAIDEVWRPGSIHHLEVGVVEVATQIARGQFSRGNQEY
jgi:hypothetical protein